MENVFSKSGITPRLRMYAAKDKEQRYYGKDPDYFVSNYIRIIKNTKYTTYKTYTYAVLDMYGETLLADYCNGKPTEINTKISSKAFYIVISGKMSDLDNVKLVNAPIDESGDDPVIPVDGKIITSTLANNFDYNEEENAYVVTDMSPSVSSYENLNDEFTLYVADIDTLVANSSIDLFGIKFKIMHITNEPLTTTMEAVASVMPFLCSKTTKTARMLYSYISTSQTGLGLEDLFLDVGDEPFKKGE